MPYVSPPPSPQWSRALALICQSPIWDSFAGQTALQQFVAEAERYASYDELPPHLKAIYRKAERALQQSGNNPQH